MPGRGSKTAVQVARPAPLQYLRKLTTLCTAQVGKGRPEPEVAPLSSWGIRDRSERASTQRWAIWRRDLVHISRWRRPNTVRGGASMAFCTRPDAFGFADKLADICASPMPPGPRLQGCETFQEWCDCGTDPAPTASGRMSGNPKAANNCGPVGGPNTVSAEIVSSASVST